MTVNQILIQQSPIPIAHLDSDLSFVDFSNQWLEHFGLSKNIKGALFFDSMPELPEELKLDINYCLEGVEQRTDTMRVLSKTGHTVWYQWKINSLKTDEDGVIGIIMILENVTNKKLEEGLLAKSQQVAKIGGWEVDLLMNTIYWSNITREIHEVPNDYVPILEEAISFYKEGHSRETITKLVQEGIDYGTPWDTELQIVTAKGKDLWVRAIGEPEMVDGKCVRITGTFQDISPLKTTQLQLEKSEESLQGAFENSSVGMALVALDGKFISVNQSLCNSLGYKNEELLQLTFQDITHPDDLEVDLSLLGEVIEGKRSTYQIEKRYFDKKGQLVYILLTVTAVKKLNGEISHFISQIVDISSRIEAEEKLKNILQVTTNQNNSLLNFAHIVSHNLRSHAANLSMISGFLLDDGLGVEERKDTLNMLGKASQGLNETITHLNEVVQVKLETEKKMKVVPLRKTVDKILVDIIALINENDVSVNINIPNNLNVKGVLAYIESIILNLVTNAIKYRDPEKKALLTIQAHPNGQYVLLSVEDNGKGIDMDRYGQKLFGMYKTFHGNKDARGIGLFITKNQIESMGGRITVESNVGIGTKFNVKLLKA